MIGSTFRSIYHKSSAQRASEADLQVRGKEATLGHFVDHQINKPKWEAWKFLPEAVQQGEVAFALAHGGSDMHQASHLPPHHLAHPGWPLFSQQD